MITRWMPSGRSTSCAPAVIRPKYGSVKTRLRKVAAYSRWFGGSLITSATESVRRVTSDRAARLGT